MAMSGTKFAKSLLGLLSKIKVPWLEGWGHTVALPNQGAADTRRSTGRIGIRGLNPGSRGFLVPFSGLDLKHQESIFLFFYFLFCFLAK